MFLSDDRVSLERYSSNFSYSRSPPPFSSLPVLSRYRSCVFFFEFFFFFSSLFINHPTVTSRVTKAFHELWNTDSLSPSDLSARGPVIPAVHLGDPFSPFLPALTLSLSDTSFSEYNENLSENFAEAFFFVSFFPPIPFRFRYWIYSQWRNFIADAWPGRVFLEFTIISNDGASGHWLQEPGKEGTSLEIAIVLAGILAATTMSVVIVLAPTVIYLWVSTDPSRVITGDVIFFSFFFFLGESVDIIVEENILIRWRNWKILVIGRLSPGRYGWYGICVERQCNTIQHY